MQNGQLVYDRCEVWDLDYSALAQLSSLSQGLEASTAEVTARLLAPTEATRPCTKWEFEDTQYGDSLIQEVGGQGRCDRMDRVLDPTTTHWENSGVRLRPQRA